MASEEFTARLSVAKQLKQLEERQRLDNFLAACFPQFSRAQLQQWIKQGQVLVGAGRSKAKPSLLLRGGEEISVKGSFPALVTDRPQPLELDIAYEDDNLLVINKPVGLVVHPGAGNPDHTLLNALLAYRAEQRQLPRAGLVHRLDVGTSGLIIAAKHPASYNYLQGLIKARQIKRNYLALVEGVPVSGGTIDRPIGRDPHNRLRMKVYRAAAAGGQPTTGHSAASRAAGAPGDLPAGVRTAVTHFRVAKKFAAHALLSVSLETGRTHQIRAHLHSLGYPLVGDKLYGWQRKLPPNPSQELISAIRSFTAPALHAASLEFTMAPVGQAPASPRAASENSEHLMTRVDSHPVGPSSAAGAGDGDDLVMPNANSPTANNFKDSYQVKLEAPLPAKLELLLQLLSQHKNNNS